MSALLAGCSTEAPSKTATAVEVLTVRVEPSAVTAVDELPGRVVAYRTAEIRPQVGGIIQRRLFEQGAAVSAGQVLFQISPAPFRADADTAKATVAKAAATYARARGQADRLKPLVEADAISRQSYDDAVAARDQAAAEVAEARATLRRRQIDLGFSRVTAPISGRIGATNVTEGALVAAADANPLATIQQIDRVYIDVRQPAEQYAALREKGAAGPVDILTSSGSLHPVKGRILFSGIAVDPTTGDALVRVEVANPGERLLPGMFVRARLPRAVIPAALTVPQQAVTRADDGAAQISVVDSQDRVHVRRVQLGPLSDGRYVIQSGLRKGEIVIVEGQDRVQSGTPVRQRSWVGRKAG
ncbi:MULTISPECIES: efflux RND transporter periplasmic adaptor subunit [Novosphingobium]|uniref:Membrane fusion protein, multidrug efflux system n=1 Tax=Novosphingobium mathurense TaxID=428990 RepID=A0A1U6GZH3_9SPHN|nr:MULTISPECIES: efflux RND transporter periplasmic adaptor subunit [Novosphingobium]CDO36739.1 Putative component of multidrug efflux pump, acrB/acrD/acrF family [Novosphingobium sp. KN65.2]SLJ88896.1 membrane fusion protein, multidrug efflux system [Novosphingobium mathurense]